MTDESREKTVVVSGEPRKNGDVDVLLNTEQVWVNKMDTII